MNDTASTGPFDPDSDEAAFLPRMQAGGGEAFEPCMHAPIGPLPEISRTVLLVRDIEGLDTDEAAQSLGTSPGVVKTRLHRARQALRALLDPHFRGGDV